MEIKFSQEVTIELQINGVSHKVNLNDYMIACTFVQNLKFGRLVNLGCSEYVIGLYPNTQYETVTALMYREWDDDGKAHFEICSFGKTKDELLKDEDFFHACLTNGDVNHSISGDVANIEQAREVMDFFNGNVDSFPCTFCGIANYLPIENQIDVELDADVAHHIFAQYGMKTPDEW